MSRREATKNALRAKFLSIGLERLGNLSSAFVELEARPDDEAVLAAIMREIHTLKGEAKLVGFGSVADVAHTTEDLLLFANELALDARAPAHRVITRGLDLMTDILSRHRDGDTSEISTSDFAAAAVAVRTEVASAAPAPATEVARPVSSTATNKFMSMRGDSSIRIDIDRLHGLTDLAGTLALDHDRSEGVVTSLEAVLAGWLAEIERAEVLASALVRENPSLASSPTFLEFADHSRAMRGLRADASRSVARARDHLFEFRLELSELDAQVRDLRLQPLATMFQQYPRAVRDLANEQQKKIGLWVEGADVQVDKEVLERLSDPLLHLIRNAVDHGIERPEERLLAGKSESATLHLSAMQRGPFVEIRIRDDGRGIDAAKLRKAVVRKGMMAQAMAETHSDEAMLAVIFEPGFSTLDAATDMSGRGVGLDVVKSHVEALGGTVHVETKLGVGTTFLLRAPIAMVFTRALLVECGDVLYAMPSEAVVCVLDVLPDQIEDVGEGRAIRVEESWVAVFDLRTLADGAQKPRDSLAIVVLEHLGRRLAVIVSGFIGERQIVQRSCDAYLSGNKLLAGTAILPSGALAVLLDVGEVIRLGRSSAGAVRGRVAASPRTESKRVVVVDDSEVTRDLIATILRSEGLEVFEAINGRDGVERIGQHRPDLVLTDLEMPVLDGFGLLAAVRNMPEHKALPIIVFSTRGSEADKRKAAQLGADAYLVKGTFREEELIALARRFVGGTSE